MFDAETVQEIAALGKRTDAHRIDVIPLEDGKQYSYSTIATENGRQLGNILTPPKPDVVSVSTLTGFRDAIDAVGPDECMIHVEDYLNVALKGKAMDYWGSRATFVKATHAPLKAFAFDQYYNDPQRFIIAVQVAFLQTDELLYLIRLASNLKAGNTVQTQDDGFSQSVTLKTGEVSTVEVKVKPRIKLIPIRTFTEASPVESEFLIRFQQTPQQTPSIALFDVDGQKWKGECMQSIKSWLKSELAALEMDMPILA